MIPDRRQPHTWYLSGAIGLQNLSVSVTFVVTCLVFLAGCAKPPDAIVGVENLSVSADQLTQVKRRDIYVMTTRAAADDPAILFSGDRSDGLSLAKVTVTIPPGHKIGQIERAKTLPPDPRRDFTIIDPNVFSSDKAFKTDLRRSMYQRGPADRDILLFVHGFNTTFTDAILRTAQFTNDMDFKGIPVVFSWASKGKLLDYVYDLNSTLAARDRLVEASHMLSTVSQSGIDVVAHSMGNFLTMEVIRQFALQDRYDIDGTVRTVILASPDIDMDVFETQIAQLPVRQRKFYVLIAADDKALGFSRRISGGVNRVGDADPDRLAKTGVTVVDLTQIKDTNSINHTKFADAPEVVQLIGRRLSEGQSLDTRGDTQVATNLARGIANIPVTAVGKGHFIVLP